MSAAAWAVIIKPILFAVIVGIKSKVKQWQS